LTLNANLLEQGERGRPMNPKIVPPDDFEVRTGSKKEKGRKATEG